MGRTDDDEAPIPTPPGTGAGAKIWRLAAFGDRDRAWTMDLLDELIQHQPYEGWDATRLADELRPLGVTPRQIAIDGTNRNGYLRGNVLCALDRA